MIKTSCTECGAKSQDGVLEHTKACRAKNFEPNIQFAETPPAIAIEFDSQEEQAEWLRKLKGGSCEL